MTLHRLLARSARSTLTGARWCGSTTARPMAAYPFQTEVQNGVEVDAQYPGTAVERLRNVLANVMALDNLDGDWREVRVALLNAGGLRADRSTSHGFTDDNHCDLTTMQADVSHNSNSDGAVVQISRRNMLGPHIQLASLP